MDISAELQAKGWYLSNEGLGMCKDGLDRINTTSVIQRALNLDMREIGGKFFTEDLKATKLDFISGSGVVQIQKVKNASAPKYEYGSGAPPILRLLLTDGNTYVNCLQWGAWNSVTLETPPGTKLYLRPGKIPMQNSFMLLSEHQFTLLGGCVTPMVEKWELQKQLASHVRGKENLDGVGPPPWIPFGKQIVNTKGKTNNFRALEQDVKDGKEDAVFKQQRLANIAEVAKVKDGKPKVFGGGKDIKQSNNKTESDSFSHHQSNSADSSGHNRYQRNANDFDDKQSPCNQNPRQWMNQEGPRPPPGGDVSTQGGPPYNRDKRLEQKNKLNSNSYHNIRNQRTYQQNGPNRDGSNRETYRDGSNRETYRDGSNRETYRDGSNRDNYRDGPNRDNYRDGPNRDNYRDGPNRDNYRDGPNRDNYRDGPNRDSGDSGYSSKKFNKGFHFDSSRSGNTNRYNSDRRSNDIEDLTQRTSQVKLHGYDNPNNRTFVPSKPFLKQGAEVMAKYWEDNKLYRAVIHAVGQEGKTCVVHFMEYGNYEEVLVDDVQPVNMSGNANWSAGPISFRPSHWESGDRNQDFPTISEYQNSSGGRSNHHGNHDRQRSNRQDFRPSAKLYQPPHQRQI